MRHKILNLFLISFVHKHTIIRSSWSYILQEIILNGMVYS